MLRTAVCERLRVACSLFATDRSPQTSQNSKTQLGHLIGPVVRVKFLDIPEADQKEFFEKPAYISVFDMT